MNKHVLPLLIIATLMAASQAAIGQEELSREQLNFFEVKIRPVLVKECYGCHSAKTGATKGGLMVDTKEALLLGGDSGPAIVPGELDESLLWGSINHEDYNMPPGKMLSEKVIADFRTWIEMGAPDPRVMKVADIKSEITDADVEKGREFWAFKKPTKPSVPRVQNESWAHSEIDQFVLAKLESSELQPADDADAETVLRRLTYGLIGLPPTPQQVDWFRKNFKRDPEAAVGKVVDQLLDSDQFGERWGRHWLDVARYGESTGREVNLTFPNAWRYRDYVIDSFNEDKPYDQFVQEQIAGDLLPAKNDEQWADNIIATGFLAIGPKTLAEQNGRQFRLDLIDEQVDVTSRAVLGVSVACARCHDHKFDPIPQSDYYAMSGIFENTSTHYGTIDTLQNRRPSNLIMLPIDDPKMKDKKLSRKELQELKDQLAEAQTEFREATRARQQMRRNGSSGNNQQQAFISVARASSRSAALKAKLDSYDANGNPLTYAMGVQKVKTPVVTRLLGRGEFDQPGQVVDRGFPQVLCEEPIELNPKSSGRLELARWMGSADNPLTARVMVNRIWQHMMGQAIVRTPENFGATGQAPTHPELLDWLAVRFVEEGWSVKTLVREIATSHIYRTSSQFNSSAFHVDPTNELLWRFEPRRLEAEALRDSILAVSGELDKQRPYSSLAGTAGEGLVRDGTIFSVADKSNSGSAMNSMSSRRGSARRGGRMQNMMASMTERAVNRAGGAITTLDQPVNYRSVYLPVVRDNIARSLEVFDFAESTMIVGKREASNTPDQGLYFLNNEFVIRQSELFAKRLMEEHKNVGDQVRGAFLRAYGRDATDAEISAARDFYEQFEVPTGRWRRDSGAALKKLTALCQGILASAEFRFLN
ncbi:PSD1 and planctomycete cytochrome C domain-containing protein [Mariniblastus fucicola]|uniref:Planctomycete cytochrome C n=1 Tax=Mariniblastus fucicola TaxID=980251 RepID=A0A5B9PFT1_9BACT|nr:PSD1 and planctomycete cytochrome C domain-containing protein [Mariniblastus fucicola]QEG24429.1 Planctomycete cytochrome C [Mariniblastus fucicola]